MAKSSKDYFGLGKLISAILCFFLGWPLGIIVRILDKNIIAAILRLILPFVVIVDFFDIILNGHIWRLLK